MAPTKASRLSQLYGAVAIIAAALILYSQTLSFTWDEGFHLVAEQLINAGKRPYIDFLFNQTPLNVWWTAFWMRIFGQTWQLAHAIAAAETALAVLLAADYVFRRFPVPEWKLKAALATAFLVGFNISVIEYGTLGQAYGICLLLTVIAFRVAVLTPQRDSVLLPALSGAAAGAAAASSLLSVTVAPVLLIWIVYRSRAGNRWIKGMAFVAGSVVPVLPLLWLFAQAPHAVWFDVVDFHIFFRQVNWDNWKVHDLEVLTAWVNCLPAFLLGALAIAGYWFLRGGEWASEIRSEFYLCGWLALTTAAYLMTAHPTFERYFLLVTPFAGILAAAGLYGLTLRTGIPAQSRWPLALLIVLVAIGAVRSVVEDSDDSWSQFDPIAAKVAEVTPPGAKLFADEHVYFLLKRMPPEGMNWNGLHKVELPLDKAAPLHILPRTELVRQVKSGEYSTVETCGQGEPDALDLAKVYRQHAEINDCFVYWDKRPAKE
ncbi:MAG TPA: hypothetical protein VG273_04110 [Bryobacteraceae bacterium]|jgi:4-amino-4-deoxy-L-arabinose transferase-like glycosyltransferase|nr:hypothetical protein [Bryobacteraceae bacterium]